MIFEEYIPTELLKPFIKCYKIIESTDEMTNRVLPHTSITIAFRYKGQVTYKSDNTQEFLSASTISGLRKSVRLFNYRKDTATVIVLFKETGAKAFFEDPLYELFEESISLDIFIKQHKLAIIEEQLAEAKNNIQRILIVEQFLLSKLCNHKPDELISTAVNKIRLMNGVIKMKELAGTLYISNDAFEKRFRKVVGTSPKQFSFIVRMEAITKQKQKAENLGEIAFNAGYYDQSHFAKDLKLFTGLTPKEFFKTSSFW